MAFIEELDLRAHAGKTVVPRGAGGNSLEAQERLTEGRNKGGKTRVQQLGYEGYSKMGKNGGLASNGAKPEQAADTHGIDIDESKFTN